MHLVRNIYLPYSVLLYPSLESVLESKFYLQAKIPVVLSNSSLKTVCAKYFMDRTMLTMTVYIEFLPHSEKCSFHSTRCYSSAKVSSNSSLILMKCLI